MWPMVVQHKFVSACKDKSIFLEAIARHKEIVAKRGYALYEDQNEGTVRRSQGLSSSIRVLMANVP